MQTVKDSQLFCSYQRHTAGADSDTIWSGRRRGYC